MTWLYHAYNVMLIPQYETPSQCHDISQVAWGLLHLLPTEVEGGASTISVTSSAIGEGSVITADVFFSRTSNIVDERMNGFKWNFPDRFGMIKGTICQTLAVPY